MRDRRPARSSPSAASFRRNSDRRPPQGGRPQLEEATKGLARFVASLSRTQKTGLGLVLLVGSVGAARFGWGWWKSRRRVSQVVLPEALTELVDALDAYVSAIQAGTVMPSDVARAVAALDATLAAQASGDINVEVSEDRMRAIGALVRRLHESIYRDVRRRSPGYGCSAVNGCRPPLASRRAAPGALRSSVR